MIVIPARLNSTRLPNKLLLPLNGIPIIIRTANIAKEVDSTIVACDDKAILNVCRLHGIECILTSTYHTSGTDRCAEVVSKLNLDDDELVINLQGDEPYIESEVISLLRDSMLNSISNNSAFMASCYKIIDEVKADDPNVVKVVIDNKNFALYFSRSRIPYNRDADSHNAYLGHMGIYAFSASSIKEFCNLPRSYIEDVEKLEQLRALFNNKKILMVKVESNSVGVDTVADYNFLLNRIGD